MNKFAALRDTTLLAIAAALSLTLTACQLLPDTRSTVPPDPLLVDFPILGRPDRSSDLPPAAGLDSIKIMLPQGASFTTWRWLRSTRGGDLYLGRTSQNRVCLLQYRPDTGQATSACPTQPAGSIEPWLAVTVETDPINGSKSSQLLAVAPARASHIEVRLPDRKPLRCAFSNNVAVVAAPPTEKTDVLVIDSTGETLSMLASAMLPEDNTDETTHCA